MNILKSEWYTEKKKETKPYNKKTLKKKKRLVGQEPLKEETLAFFVPVVPTGLDLAFAYYLMIFCDPITLVIFMLS